MGVKEWIIAVETILQINSFDGKIELRDRVHSIQKYPGPSSPRYHTENHLIYMYIFLQTDLQVNIFFSSDEASRLRKSDQQKPDN